MHLKNSPSVNAMVRELAEKPSVGAPEIIGVLVRDHKHYAHRQAQDILIAWPPESGIRAPIEEYLGWIDELYVEGAWKGELHGRAVIVAASLLDRGAGRAVVASGLFHAIATELEPHPRTVLTEDGLARLRSIPLADVQAGTVLDTSVPAHRVALSRDGAVALAASGQELEIYDAEIGAGRGVYAAAGVTAAALSADGEEVRIASKDRLLRIDARDGREISAMQPFGAVGSFGWAVASDSGVLVVAEPSGSWVAVMEGGGGIRTLDLGVAPMLVAASPDGRLLAMAESDGATQVVDLGSGEAVRGPARAASEPPLAVDNLGRLAGLGLSVAAGTAIVDIGPATSSVAFSPDGRFLAAVEGEGVTIRETAGNRPVAVLEGAPDGPVRFSGDGHWLIQGGARPRLWDVGLTPVPTPIPPIAFSADVADGLGDDLLSIDPAVDAFASLIAARDLEPPLSIGIFGDWGSGKTFFMRRLRHRVGIRSKAARDSRVPQREISFAKRIVQIEFNAWHYSGGNLWAALVQHIFDNLSLFGEDSPSAVVRRQQEILRRIDELGETERALADQQEKVEEARRRARSALDGLAERHAAQLDRLEGLSSLGPEEVADALETAGLLDDAAELRHRAGADVAAEPDQALVDEAQRAIDLMRRTGPAVAALRQGSRRQVAAFAIAAIVPAAIGVALAFVNGIAGAVSAVGTWLALGAGWLTRANDWYEQRLGRYEQVRAVLTRAIEEKQRKQAGERHQLEASIAAIEARITDIGREIERAERQRFLLADEILEITPTRVLADFILERAQADDYRRELGLHARIRDDFEQIAGILDEQRRSIGTAASIEEEDAQGEHRIDRIVLYVDDLDRCEPEIVVNVLQAVHLLLAFPIFVVVVGVDARWVSRALAKRYPDLLQSADGKGDGDPDRGADAAAEGDSGMASSLDYLEKIFQIPYWLPRLDSNTAEEFVGGLVGAAPAVAGTPLPGPGAAPPPDSGRAPAAQETAEQAASSAKAAPPRATPTPDLTPQALTMSRAEREYMRSIAGLSGSSPREVKRFLNLYRLAKVMASDPLDFVNVREGYGAPCQAVMILLAIETGMPRDADALVAALADRARPRLGDVVAEPAPAVGAEAWSTFTAWVNAAPDRQALRTDLFAQWAPLVGQFSFRVDGRAP